MIFKTLLLEEEWKLKFRIDVISWWEEVEAIRIK